MRDAQFLVADSLNDAVEELSRKFGLWRSVFALLHLAWQQRRAGNQVRYLSNHLRRDIGLPEAPDRSHQEKLDLWMIRF